MPDGPALLAAVSLVVPEASRGLDASIGAGLDLKVLRAGLEATPAVPPPTISAAALTG